MRFRQVHLDFHTSEAISSIGEAFDKAQFQQMLKLGKVDSITVFAKCHHGWAYHPTEANEMHPGLKFDLLGAMIEAAHEIGVKTPVYISAGLDEKLARRRPEWLIRDERERTNWAPDFMTPGYHQFCMNTPYLDLLIRQIEEVVANYDADGIFLDIVGVRKCYCQYCIASIRAMGKDPRDLDAMRQLWENTYRKYGQRVKDAIHALKPGMPIFHNSGHIRKGRRDLAAFNTHLELESLPTGGWGYDHFPLSARYAQTLGMDFLGMTGKFHTSWGEFGGYKHPNALRYETSLSLANGGGCSIGDQLDPSGKMDEATYALIGTAYEEVEAKEPWCKDVDNVADVALLSLESLDVYYNSGGESRTNSSDNGAVRMLLEGKILFDVIDWEHDFHRYKVLILPDHAAVDDHLQAKLRAFVQQGGKILASGRSGMDPQYQRFAIDLGVKWLGAAPYRPSYFRPGFPLQSFNNAAFVCYAEGQLVELDGGAELGRRENPYFNRDLFTFCSHRHTPNSGQYGGPAMVESSSGIYIAWNIFEEYAEHGSLFLKETVLYALEQLMSGNKTLETDLPAQGIVTLQHQKSERRYVQHSLYASPVRRGKEIEIIEDVLPVYDVNVTVRVPETVSRVYLAPQMKELPFQVSGTAISYTVPKLDCHQIVVLEYEQ